MRAYIVVDLGFGDAGKGLLTDFLVRHLNAGLVVRYNGGAQAGHNVVVPDGRHHTFSQFGSGTFNPNVKTFLSQYVVVHPQAMLVEGDILVKKGVQDAFSRLRVSDQALVITPFHQATNHIREILRGGGRHGSCGVGVGETVEDDLKDTAASVRAKDLLDPATLRQKLYTIRRRKREEVAALCLDNDIDAFLARELEIFDREDVVDTWIASIRRIGEYGLVVPDSVLERWLREEDTAIFEGAQGILLDADAGFHPFTTWSRCTTENASMILGEMAPDSLISRIGILRSYMVRHGPGPLPTETNDLKSTIVEHNQNNPWQGQVRYGWFDAVLARYSLNIAASLDFLLLTHMDVLAKLKRWKYCTAYQTLSDSQSGLALEGKMLENIPSLSALSLSKRALFSQALSDVTPRLEDSDAREENVIRQVEYLLKKSVDLISNGPSAQDVQILSSRKI